MLTRRAFISLALALAAARSKTKKRLLLLWMLGGPSQIDTFDPKPGHANGGPFRAIDTAVSGIRISEHLPSIAAEMKRIALIRSMTSGEGNHDRARYFGATGYLPSTTAQHPSMGSVVAHELGEGDALPPFIHLGRGAIGGGFLGRASSPFVVADRDAGERPRLLDPPPSIEPARFQRRLRILDAVSSAYTGRIADGSKATRDAALRMMRAERLDAFELANESDDVKRAYGDETFGKSMLVARRLLEAGVKAVEVTLPGWDTHTDNFAQTKSLSSTLDRALGAFLVDASRRGLLEDVLVVWMGEFGRTPRINDRGGRDHHPAAYTVALAGANIRGGQVVGATSADGMEVADRPVKVPDLLATVYRALELPLDATFHTEDGRPIGIVQEGAKPIGEVLLKA